MTRSEKAYQKFLRNVERVTKSANEVEQHYKIYQRDVTWDHFVVRRYSKPSDCINLSRQDRDLDLNTHGVSRYSGRGDHVTGWKKYIQEGIDLLNSCYEFKADYSDDQVEKLTALAEVLVKQGNNYLNFKKNQDPSYTRYISDGGGIFTPVDTVPSRRRLLETIEIGFLSEHQRPNERLGG